MTDDDPVVQYLAALEARRAAPSTFPDPNRVPDDLAAAEMVTMEPATDTDALGEDLAAHTPGAEANVERLEDDFVTHARAYAERHDIRYEGWIQAGVAPEVLARAGIHPDNG